MKLHFLLASVVAVGLQISAPDTMAHGGGGSGGGGGHSGGGRGGNFHGGWHGGGFHGHGHGRFFHGRFFGPGFGFYDYGYPWWNWDYSYYPYYPYYGSGYDNAYYSGPNEGDRDSGFNSPRAVQAALAWRGYYSGRIDDVMGPETRAAIRSFQAHQGLPVTGQIDNGLINALRR